MIDYAVLANSIKEWGKALGFHDVRIADAQADMSKVESELSEWLSKEYHGDMDYMAKHGTKRSRTRTGDATCHIRMHELCAA